MSTDNRLLLAGVDSEDTASPCQLGKVRILKPIPLESRRKWLT